LPPGQSGGYNKHNDSRDWDKDRNRDNDKDRYQNRDCDREFDRDHDKNRSGWKRTRR